MKITVAQLNPVIGDIDGNMAKVVHVLPQCLKDASDLIVFPELFLAGYPPRDLLERPHFIERIQQAIEKLKKISTDYPHTGILIGAPLPTEKKTGYGLFNSALLIYQGQILDTQHKSLLPTYDVFDEARYFEPAPNIQNVSFKGEMLGLTICEDVWNDPELWKQRKYSLTP